MNLAHANQHIMFFVMLRHGVCGEVRPIGCRLAI